jgi:1,4-alpha-glucan branching enzyme
VPLAFHPQPPPAPSRKPTKELRMKKSSDDKSAAQTSTPFSFEAPKARQVSLAGDFNNWDPETMPMYKGSNGVWYLTVSLRPGLHEYRFVADGIWKDDPTAQQKISNSMGTENCVKTVSAEIIGGQTQRPGSTGLGRITL